jgi:hypothetical protein
MIKMIKKIKLSDWLSAAAIVLAIIVFVRDCSQNKRIEELGYISNALQFRPILQVLGSPRIYSYEIQSDRVALPNFSTAPESTDSIQDINASLRIHAKLRFVNAGNAIANVYAFVWADTSSGSPMIRADLLNRTLREQRFVPSPDTDYFYIKDIRPGDTCDFQIAHDVRFFIEQKFTMHFLLLYGNEAGGLFDTYYWARFTTMPILWKAEFAIIDGKLAYRVGVDRKQLREFLTLCDQNISWKVYSKADAEDVLSFIKRHSKQDSN